MESRWRARGYSLLTQFFPPETGAGANRIGPMARGVEQVLRSPGSRPEAELSFPQEYEGVSSEGPRRQISLCGEANIQLQPSQGFVALADRCASSVMALRLALRALPESVDILVTSSPSMFLGPVGLAVAKVKKRQVRVGCSRHYVGIRERCGRAFAQDDLRRAYAGEVYDLYALRRADLVVGASQGITSDAGGGRGRDRDKAITVPNGISTDLLEDYRARNGRERWRTGGPWWPMRV